MKLGLVVEVGVQAGTLTEGELQFVESYGDGVGGISQLSGVGVSSHDRQGSPISEGRPCCPLT